MSYIDKRSAQQRKGAKPMPAVVPDYLQDHYHWAYLNPKNVRLLSAAPVVSAILWGNAQRLIRCVTREIEPNSRVLQAACVYGPFSEKLARAVGRDGLLKIVDVAPIQVEHARKNLNALEQVEIVQDDVAYMQTETYDTVVCFFLLHEVPELVRVKIITTLLEAVAPGGQLVIVDYHKPSKWHPLKGLMGWVFDKLEPFARDLWACEIEELAPFGHGCHWRKETYFGGLYQKVVALKQVVPNHSDGEKQQKTAGDVA